MKKHYLPAEAVIPSEMQQTSVCANAGVPAEQEPTSKAAEATKEVGADSPHTPVLFAALSEWALGRDFYVPCLKTLLC